MRILLVHSKDEDIQTSFVSEECPNERELHTCATGWKGNCIRRQLPWQFYFALNC